MKDQEQTEKDKESNVPTIVYSKEELEVVGKDMRDMMDARNMRENTHDEFDGMTYTQYCESNRKGANTYIQPRKNKEDTNFMTGTTRQKLWVLLSYLNNLNITSGVNAFDDKNISDMGIASSLESIIEKTGILDGDEEKKLLRQYVMLEQGTVFVEEVWREQWETVKKQITKFNGSNFKDADWVTFMKQVSSGPTRNVLLPENVYLGDITVFDMDKQPFIFTVEQVPYSYALSIYGSWERWKYVTKNVKHLTQSTEDTKYNQNWSITETLANHCEIVKKQDRFSNTFAIYINGILMTPVGLPIPRKWGERVEYNIVKQVNEIISPYFSYGKSLVARFKVKQQILDEMMRLAILKTQQSFIPAKANLSGNIVSSRIFMPGKITTGIDPKLLPNLTDATGMSKTELTMIQNIQASIDDDSAAPALSGKNPAGVNRISATQSQSLRASAELLTTLIVFSATMLEMKCDTMRLWNILENWFDPIGEDVIGADKNVIMKKYRSVNTDKMIDGEGPGQHIVRVTDKPVDPMQVFNEEEQIKRDTGKPTRITYLDRKIVLAGKHTFYIIASSKPKKTSDLQKVLFNEMFETAQQFPNLDVDYMSERFAVTWGEDPTKMFKKMSDVPQQDPNDPNAQAGAGGNNNPQGQNGLNAKSNPAGSIMPKNMKRAGSPIKPSINTLTGAGASQ